MQRRPPKKGRVSADRRRSTIVHTLTIQGVWLKEPKTIHDARGSLTQLLDGSDGDIYKAMYEVTFREPTMVRANHYHWKKTEYLRALKGGVELILIDLREKSETYEYRNVHCLTPRSGLIRVPAGVAHALISIDPGTVVQVLATEHHDPTDDHPHLVIQTKGHFFHSKR